MIDLVGFHMPSRGLEKPVLGGLRDQRGGERGREGEGEGQILDVSGNPSLGPHTRSNKLLSLIHN